jgi:hypothetical protein
MKTYVEIYHSADGKEVSVIFEKMRSLGFEPALGEHEFVYNWKETVTLAEIIQFLDQVIAKLKGTGALLKFTTIR